MIIDFHTHTYPSNIAKRIIDKLSGPSNVSAYTDATNEGLIDSLNRNGISKCILLPVATTPAQTENINRIAVETNQHNGPLISFGGIHPDNTDYKAIISKLSREGVLGIKIHPVFQKTYIDDIRYMRIIESACEYGLIISVHAGYDINDPSATFSSALHIRNLLKAIQPDKLILAHMGCHLCWNDAENMLNEYLSNAPRDKVLYLDTAFSLPSPVSSQNINYDFLSNEQFLRIVRLVGSEHVLFGTDSPWTDQGSSVEAIMNSGLNKKEISQILYENAKNLLNISD